MTELVKAGEHWALLVLLASARLVSVCDVYTRACSAGDYTTAVTDTGTRWCKRAESPRQLGAGQSVSAAGFLSPWRRHPATVIQQPPAAGDQLSLPEWPVGAGVCYELTSAEH